MPPSNAAKILRHLRGAVLREGVGLSDGQLLDHCIHRHDQAAFAALVRRHGPMVWGVCRRVLGNHHDAEDAFQATFLVLVRKAASILPREMVANWLHGVAHLTALKARAAAARRRTRERQVRAMPEPEVIDRDLWHDLQPLLDHELSRLPDKYRAAVVLCDLEGKTYKEAARQLGCPEGTLAARLARSRALLAKRLAQHGLTISGSAVAVALAENASSACVPAAVASSTVTAVSLLAAGQAAAAGAIPLKVAVLTEGVLKTMLLTKLKAGTGLCLAVGLVLLLGTGWGYGTFAGDKPQAEKQVDSLRDTLLVLDKQFWEAGGKHDVDTLSKLIAHDFVAIAADGTKSTKGATLQNYRTMRTADLKLTSEREVVRVDEHAAMLTYQGKFKVYAKSGELIATLHQCMTSCWVQRDGGWFVVFSRVTDLPKLETQAKVLQYPLQYQMSNFTTLPFHANLSSSTMTNLAQPTSLQFSSTGLSNSHLSTSTLLSLQQPTNDLPQLVAKTLKAYGGEDKLSALTAFTERVIFRTEDVATADHFVQLPNKYRFETKTGPAGKTQTHTFILNGGERWHLLNGVRVELLGLERPTEYWEDYLKYYGPRAVLRLKDPTNQLHLLSESKIGDRAVVGIQIVPKDEHGPERKMYFDKETGLLLKEECAAQELEIVYKDYKTLAGFPIAQKRIAKIVGHENETEVVDFKAVDKLDGKLFEKP
jgi:RNA polymerase sigma factor (sigma-70 family)